MTLAAVRSVRDTPRVGLLDDLFWHVGPTGPQIAGRRGGRVLQEGQEGEATVVGIRTDRSGDDDSTDPPYTWALDVRCGGETFRCGLRQRGLLRRQMHVGAVVPVRVLRGRVAVDDDRMRGTVREGKVFLAGWKMKDPPVDGVEDRYARRDQKRIRDGRAALATILALHSQGPAIVDVHADVLLAFGDTGESDQRRIKLRPPDYASYLVTVGTILPVGVDKEGRRVTVDWSSSQRHGRL